MRVLQLPLKEMCISMGIESIFFFVQQKLFEIKFKSNHRQTFPSRENTKPEQKTRHIPPPPKIGI